MKLHNLLPLALATALLGCGTPSLNDTLPKSSLQNPLPSVTDNAYCNSQMDSDILYGVGMSLFNDEQHAEAKSCLVMAAPKHQRAFCYLSMIAEQEADKSTEERQRESFHYMAYSAAQNDWCAEYGLYQVYLFGSKGMPQDKPLALRWLERSALHGAPDSQQILADEYAEQGDLVASYAWLRIIDNQQDTSELDALKTKLTPEQLSAAEKRYQALRPQVVTKEAMYAEAREEDVGRYSADIQLAYPDTFKGMTSTERYAFVKQTMLTGLDLPYLQSRDQVARYILIARYAHLKNAPVEALQNPRIVALLSDEELATAEALKQARQILDQA
ncbi:sel1 repeat family protein [Pseudomonas protegens]|uniref:sel1 repeat family protein n=1 Tax=Pseudomonas protegens TaxID=380021 RepID=UPI0029372894|nr:sel1 repeat family protein [Pseudomonas protegens]WOE80599.1 sel1 repeat family protein [Pseudomonas protegens]